MCLKGNPEVMKNLDNWCNDIRQYSGHLQLVNVQWFKKKMQFD